MTCRKAQTGARRTASPRLNSVISDGRRWLRLHLSGLLLLQGLGEGALRGCVPGPRVSGVLDARCGGSVRRRKMPKSPLCFRPACWGLDWDLGPRDAASERQNVQNRRSGRRSTAGFPTEKATSLGPWSAEFVMLLSKSGCISSDCGSILTLKVHSRSASSKAAGRSVGLSTG